jgi:BirA family biotin operon repressor/biotin-[acetyl-CoA-carboxylase] ligase
LAAAVAVAVAIHETEINPALKWPNDIMIGYRKVGGILTEARFDKKQVGFVIIGVGINVNTVPDDFPVSIRNLATSLRIHARKAVSRIALLQASLHHLEHWYELFCQGSFDTILQAWRKYETVLGRMVEVYLANSTLVGVAEDLDSDGALLVRDNGGDLHRILAGDVIYCRTPENQALPALGQAGSP